VESGQEVSIVGLGYVGLPLLALAARSGWSVIGIDSDQRIIDELRQGISHIEDVEGEHILSLQTQGKVKFASSVESVSDSDVVVFCLPTPLRGKQPDLTLLLEAVESYSPNFKDEVLIISESSSYPGTLREKIMPICEKFKGEKVFHYGHSPERVDPGNKLWNNFNTPRIISGIDRTSLEKIRNFYGSFCRELVEVDSPEIAEAAKMFENSFRQVNIALVNEFARYCHQVGISGRAVLDAAATKPFGFMKFNYGAGVGGHCIPVDPYYLLEHARGNGRDLELIDVSNRINSQQPQYVFERITEIT
jgi:UDP-N-acetyl-D-glucosamine dehydrogenase